MTTMTAGRTSTRLDWSATPVLTVIGFAGLPGVAAGTRAAVLVVWAVPVVWAAALDAQTSRLPDRVVVVGTVVVGATFLGAAVIEGSWSLATGAALGAAVLGVPFAVMHLLSPAGFGFGDVKFGFLVGTGLGVVRPGLGVAVFATAALLQVAVTVCRPWPAQRGPGANRRAAPFGPAVAIAAIGWLLAVMVSGGGV